MDGMAGMDGMDGVIYSSDKRVCMQATSVREHTSRESWKRRGGGVAWPRRGGLGRPRWYRCLSMPQAKPLPLISFTGRPRIYQVDFVQFCRANPINKKHAWCDAGLAGARRACEVRGGLVPSGWKHMERVEAIGVGGVDGE